MNASVNGFFTKFFSTDAIVSRVIRGLVLAVGAISIMGHFPTNGSEWSGIMAAFVGGLINAGQNNSSSSSATMADIKAVPPKA